MTREEAIDKLQDLWNEVYNEDSDGYEYAEAIDMAIEALSKPNYETDTEVRLAVTNRNKDKVVLWDAFGEVEYYPNGEINCVHCPHYHETEDETGVHSHCGSRGRLIDADALSKKLCGTTIFIKDGEVFQRMINDAPTVPVVDITQRDLCEDISCTDCPFMQETCKLMDYVAYADRPHGEWICKGDYAECSECGGSSGTQFDGVEPIPRITAFCPHCGVDMRKETE